MRVSFSLRNVEKWDIMRIGFVSVEENMKVEYIIGIATFVIGSGGIVAVAKSIFPNWGLKNQKKIELNTELAKDKINAIKKVIKLEQEANIIEDVNIVHPELFNVKSNNPKEDWTIYMTIVEDRKKLGEFLNKLHEIRKYEDTWLSRRVSAYLQKNMLCNLWNFLSIWNTQRMICIHLAYCLHRIYKNGKES